MARKWWGKSSTKPETQPDNQEDIIDLADEKLEIPPASSTCSSRWWFPFKFSRRRRVGGHGQLGVMKKFGFGKKSEGDDDDGNRARLFGRKKPAGKDDNPYAQQPTEDPYARMTPYQQARADLAAGPQGPRPGAVGLPSGPGARLPSGPGAGLPNGPAPRNGYSTPPPSYQGSQQGGGYAPEKFGTTGGYGSNRFDAGAPAYGSARSSPALPSQRFPSRGPGGYGGLGSTDDDINRHDLLAGAQQRHAPPPAYPGTDNAVSGVSGASDGSYGGGYGEQRELTEEEKEEQEYQSIVDEGKQIKRDGIASLQRSKQEGYRALGIVAGTNVRLAEQEEMLRNAEKNLDIANAHHKIADDKTRELKTVTRSMFAVHVANPFTKGKREARLEQAVLERHREERDVAEETRKGSYLAKQQNAQAFEPMMMGRPKPPAPSAEAAAQSKSRYAFSEDDAEDVGLEKDMDKEQVELSGLVSKLKDAAEYQGVMLGRQTKLIDVLGDKSKRLDEGLAVTRAKLSNIR